MLDQAHHQKEPVFASYMKHFGKTPEEQLEKNKPLMEWLIKQMEEAKKLTESEKIERERQWEEFKEIIDSFRPEGHKLYSEE
jgi:hypothetical protein